MLAGSASATSPGAAASPAVWGVSGSSVCPDKAGMLCATKRAIANR